ncbi:hypothetical protein SAMN05444172_8979 [Burkholderia sp. GAS332]|nr:hypothetical protein SAMN05444172_8979 [Burkholderia sp. GAS332]
MKKFSGIDLHSNNTVVVVSDEVGHIVYQRRLPTTRCRSAPHWRRIAKNWKVWSSRQRTTGTGWSMHCLRMDGYHVHLANPAAIRQYEGLKYSGDFTDAAHLAMIASTRGSSSFSARQADAHQAVRPDLASRTAPAMLGPVLSCVG